MNSLKESFFLFTSGVHVPEHYHFVGGSIELPSSEDEDVGAN